MAPPKKDQEVKEETKETPKEIKVITVWKGWENSTEIQESDLDLWKAAGYSDEKPEQPMTLTEQALLIAKLRK